MRIGILHNTLNVMGGAEVLALSLIQRLQTDGHTVIIGTFDKPNFDAINRRMNKEIIPCECIYILPRELPIFGIYQRTMLKFVANALSKRTDVTINTHSDHLFCRTDIVYMNGVIDKGTLLNKHVPLWKRLYYIPHTILTDERRVGGRFTSGVFGSDTQFISNSEYTAEKLKRIYGIDSIVIYPPVDLDPYTRGLEYYERENSVITVARSAPEKNLLAIPEIIKRTDPNIKFNLVTTAKRGPDIEILRRLSLAREALKGRLFIYKDMTQDSKQELLQESKVYLHTSTFEHFGISVVEGIASGLKPVVVDHGGQLEIVKGIPDSIYSNYDEAAELISKAVDKWTKRDAQKLSKMMINFTEEKFYNSIYECINRAYASKQNA